MSRKYNISVMQMCALLVSLKSFKKTVNDPSRCDMRETCSLRGEGFVVTRCHVVFFFSFRMCSLNMHMLMNPRFPLNARY